MLSIDNFFVLLLIGCVLVGCPFVVFGWLRVVSVYG